MNPEADTIDMADLESLFNQIGKVKFFKDFKTNVVVVYFSYNDCFIAYEFLRNAANFKNPSFSSSFTLNWIDFDQHLSLFPQDVIDELIKIQLETPIYSSSNLSNKKIKNLTTSYLYNTKLISKSVLSNESTSTASESTSLSHGNSNFSSDSNVVNVQSVSFNNDPSLLYKQNSKFNHNHNHGSQISFFSKDIDKKASNKYTCKYEILIDNDKEFQISRKLIGPKGYNMKKIVDLCTSDNTCDNDIKLRLRGKGSGFKEGPMNKESDDKLHLCVSSKNEDKYLQACELVEELLETVFSEYKHFCTKRNKQQIVSIYQKKIEGLQSSKQAK